MLHLNGLGKRFGDQWILRDLNLQVREGECVALLGPSGCGKSTALRLIAGLERQDEGSIELDGARLDTIPAERRRIAMVFQSYALFPHLSVRENLNLGLKIRGVAPAQRQQRINSVLDTVRLREMAVRRPQQLSGGQRQRVALARALLRDPRVYLLDEPMSNLDAQLRDELRPELRQLILQGSQPVVYVTHDQQEAMALANRIAVLKGGCIEQIGTPEELYKTPASCFVASFIGRPQINLLNIDQQLTIGIRPEDLHFDPEGMPCRLISREWQGASQLLLLDSPRGALRMLCSGDAALGESLSVSWPTRAEHRFDASCGRRLAG
ncbi:ABC transporter possibly for trehalose/maltose, ATP binding component [Parasynechococcus marenigrum WH 8102]|uniref:ABC transporter possibly for trehalose/maltose, ATP binding component n=2 Tax=Parasynechococcus TaxID=2881427 RepID=Q7U6Q3_PARMW|nr:ABC transporter ATP-binding protein [Parasynechococcus marenigrum]CAE07800.1 ABC transporter possibly for trehalose/maltose, ATP binding component [Parasynechococcus marenigrum WH 8102]